MILVTPEEPSYRLDRPWMGADKMRYINTACFQCIHTVGIEMLHNSLSLSIIIYLQLR